ncbi:lyase [Virgisporangium aliadipatigenens]|uniref:Lyase n=1 Tax=Virgisporangium aliadipatigenens TaxID=741659 RepID=A0A8J3YUG5_9ACTN|nr:VOC family protein [Virgisporangium aliadipatigenens]GIJ52114.1 lyase [Virgisporangium aliadipatigenens]
MNVRLQHCFIAVDDHDKAIHFYRDLLGLEITNDVAYEGMRWVSMTPPAQPEIQIVLENPDASPDASAADREILKDLLAKGLLRGVVFEVDDVDATFDRVQAGGAEVLQEPIDQHYGVRDCAFRDPAGNMIRINQRKK